MVNHLPLRYRFVIWVAGLVAFAGAGAWLALDPRVPVAWQLGGVLGLLLGALAVASFLRALEGGSGHRRDGGSRQVA